MPERKQAIYQKGVDAEHLAAAHLRGKGYEILEMRYKTPHGEVDIIARAGALLAFVEVKARKSEAEGLYAITPKAQGRIEKAALQYWAGHPEYAGFDLRFDVIAVCDDGGEKGMGGILVSHLDNAWMVGG